MGNGTWKTRGTGRLLESGDPRFALPNHRPHPSFHPLLPNAGAPMSRRGMAAATLKSFSGADAREAVSAGFAPAPKSIATPVFVVGLLVSLLALAGCLDSATTPSNEYLLRVGKSVLTVHEFNQALEMDKAAYPYDSLEDPVHIGEMKKRLLLRMMEEMVLIERAGELGIRVSEEEVEKAAADIEADYPEETFQETLLERAVSYDAWVLRLKKRLIMEKVIAAEVGSAVEISARDLATHYEKHGPGAPPSKIGVPADPGASEDRMLKALRREKTEEAYQEWLKALIQTHPIEVNEALWERMLQPETVESKSLQPSTFNLQPITILADARC